MKKTLVLLEFKDETEYFINNHFMKHNDNNYLILPLSFESKLALKKENISYSDPLIFFTNESHSGSLAKSEEWLDIIRNNIKIENVYKTELLMKLRYIINYFLWFKEVVSNAIQSFSPDFILCTDGTTSKKKGDCSIRYDERPIGFFLKDFANSARIKLIKLDFGLKPKTGNDLLTGIDKITKLSRIFDLLILKIISYKTKKYNFIMLSSNGYGLAEFSKTLLLNTGFNSLIKVYFPKKPGSFYLRLKLLYKSINIRRTGKNGNTEISLPLPLFQDINNQNLKKRAEIISSSLKKLSLKIKNDLNVRFKIDHFNLSEYLSERIENDFTEYFTWLIYNENSFHYILRQLKPKLILSPYSTGESAICGNEAKKLGIPSVLIPHGSLKKPSSNLEKIEEEWLGKGQMLADTYDYTCAQSRFSYDFAQYFNILDRTMVTGPLIFGLPTEKKKREKLRLKLKIKDRTKVLTYAVSQRKRSSVRFQIFQTEDEMLDSLKDIVNSVNMLNNVHLIIKLHPSSEFSEKDLIDYLPECSKLSILHKEPFSQVLAASDIIISYISTAIEEALLNNLPVILYDKWERSCYADTNACVKRDEKSEWDNQGIFYITKPSLLSNAINNVIENIKIQRIKRVFDKYMINSEKFTKFEDYLDQFVSKFDLKK